MNRRITFLCLLLASLLLTSCSCSQGESKKAEKLSAELSKPSRKDNLNISILLDLSDRISPEKHPNPSMEYSRRDMGYIQSIATGFEKHLRSKPIRQIDDQICIYFEPEPSNAKINDLAKSLKLSFTRDNASKDEITKVASLYTSTSKEIYDLAVNDRNYVGSDIWGFFKDKIHSYCIKPEHRNILFILTDGYMFHQDSKFIKGNRSSYLTPALVKSLKLNTSNFNDVIEMNGYGFVKANDNLSELEVVILGINPAKGNPFEGEIIERYWVNWLKEMKVKGPVLKPFSADLPSNIDPIIQKIITP